MAAAVRAGGTSCPFRGVVIAPRRRDSFGMSSFSRSAQNRAAAVVTTASGAKITRSESCCVATKRTRRRSNRINLKACRNITRSDNQGLLSVLSRRATPHRSLGPSSSMRRVDVSPAASMSKDRRGTCARRITPYLPGCCMTSFGALQSRFVSRDHHKLITDSRPIGGCNQLRQFS